MATKRAMVTAARAMATATKRAKVARAMVMATKRAVAMAERAMAMATKRAMATNGDNTGNGCGKEGDRRLMVATMAMGMGRAQRTGPLTL